MKILFQKNIMKISNINPVICRLFNNSIKTENLKLLFLLLIYTYLILCRVIRAHFVCVFFPSIQIYRN